MTGQSENTTIDKPPKQSYETAYLDNFAKLTTAIDELVQTEYLLPYKMPHWGWPEEQPLPLGRVGKWLHWLSARQDEFVFLFPTKFMLTFGLLISLILEGIYPDVLSSLLYILSILSGVPIYSLSWQAIGALLLICVFLFFGFLLPLFSAVGAYWTLFELMSNRLLTRRLRLVVMLIALAIIGLWLADGGVRLSNAMEMDYGGTEIQQTALAIQQNPTYLIFSAFLFYIPALSHGSLWLTRLVVAIAITISTAFHWFFSFHRMHSVKTLNKFLSTPLSIDEEKPQTLLQLKIQQIDALYEWSLCRRDAVQNKLVPTTIFLAFLGLLANTSLGESAIQVVMDTLRDYFQTIGSLIWIINYLRFTLLMAIIVLPVRIIFDLLNEAFTMDFITQACIVARHAKISNVVETDTPHHQEKSPGLFSRVKRWLTGPSKARPQKKNKT